MVRLFSQIGAMLLVFGAFWPVVANAEILRNLKVGDRGEDVRELQTILNKNSDTRVALTGPGSPGNETAYFGILTKVAVIKFQEKYAADILKPAGLIRGTGFVGAQTRLFLLRLLSGGGVPPPVVASRAPAALPPKISSITPGIVTKSTTELIIAGENFTQTGNSVVASSELPTAFINLSSSDGKTIKFKFNFAAAAELKKQIAPIVASGNYTAFSAALSKNIQERVSKTGNAQIPVQVQIRNANGESAPFRLLVDITEILKEIGPTPQ